MHLRRAEQIILVRAKTPDVGIAENKNAFLGRRFLQLHIVRAAQSELILMNHEPFSVDRLLPADVFQRRPAQLSIKAAEKISFADRKPQTRRHKDLKKPFKQQRDERETDQDRSQSKQKKFERTRVARRSH